MIKKYNLFLESIEQNINHLIEDAFVPMCDEHGLDFRTMKGYFVNTMGSNVPNQWITHGLIDDVKFMFREQGEQLIYKKAIQVTFLRSESWSQNYVGEISDEKKIESLNKDFNDCIKRFNRMNQTNYKLTHLPDEIKQTFWQIVFYLVES